MLSNDEHQEKPLVEGTEKSALQRGMIAANVKRC